jgi:hypothetical protein
MARRRLYCKDDFQENIVDLAEVFHINSQIILHNQKRKGRKKREEEDNGIQESVVDGVNAHQVTVRKSMCIVFKVYQSMKWEIFPPRNAAMDFYRQYRNLFAFARKRHSSKALGSIRSAIAHRPFIKHFFVTFVSTVRYILVNRVSRYIWPCSMPQWLVQVCRIKGV